MNKLSLKTVGILQALGIAAYCGLIALLFIALDEFMQQPPQYFIMIFMLILLVFSAAVTGMLYFGYAGYLALRQKIKDALILVGITTLSLLGIGIIILVVMGIVMAMSI